MKKLITVAIILSAFLAQSQSIKKSQTDNIRLTKNKDYKVNYYVNGNLKKSVKSNKYKYYLVKKIKGFTVKITNDSINKIHIISYENELLRFQKDNSQDALEDYNKNDLYDIDAIENERL